MQAFVDAWSQGRLRGDVHAAGPPQPAGEPADLLPRRLPAREPRRGHREGHDRPAGPAAQRRRRARPGEGHDGGLRDARGHDDVQGLRGRAGRGPRRVDARAAAPRPRGGRGGAPPQRPPAAAREHLRRRRAAAELGSDRRLDRGHRGRQADRARAHLRRPAGRAPELDAAVRRPRDRARRRPAREVGQHDDPARAAAQRAERAGRRSRRDRGDPPARRRGARARRPRRLRAPAARARA